MTLAVLASSVVLGVGAQVAPARIQDQVKIHRNYIWYVAPGGGFCPGPTPYFTVSIPVDYLEAYGVFLPKVESFSMVLRPLYEGKTFQSFGATTIDEHSLAVRGTDLSTAGQPSTTSKLNCRPNDPKTVLDPIVTGF